MLSLHKLEEYAKHWAKPENQKKDNYSCQDAEKIKSMTNNSVGSQQIIQISRQKMQAATAFE